MATSKKEEIEELDEYEEVSLEDRVIGMEKKVNWILGLCVIITILSLLISVFVLTGEGSKNNTSNNETNTEEKEQETSNSYDVSAFKEIKAQDIAKESKNKKIMVYIGRSTCGYCVQFVPILTQVQKTLGGYTTYYIDIAKILDYSNGGVLDKEANDIMEKMKTTKDQADVMQDWGATPMTLIIKNNQITNSLIGYTDADTVTQFVKDNGLAK